MSRVSIEISVRYDLFRRRVQTNITLIYTRESNGRTRDDNTELINSRLTFKEKKSFQNGNTSLGEKCPRIRSRHNYVYICTRQTNAYTVCHSIVVVYVRTRFFHDDGAKDVMIINTVAFVTSEKPEGESRSSRPLDLDRSPQKTDVRADRRPRRVAEKTFTSTSTIIRVTYVLHTHTRIYVGRFIFYV